jgi:hypothetical protein
MARAIRLEAASGTITGAPAVAWSALNQLDEGFDASPALADGELFLRGRRYLYKIARR